MAATKHGERAHAPFSPSSTERWLACPWSVAPNGPEPENKPSVWTELGTAIHERAEKHLLAWTDPAYDDEPLTYINPKTKKTVAVPKAEWLPHVRTYVHVVRDAYAMAEMLCEGEAKPLMLVEERVTVVGNDCWGTLDAGIVVPNVYARIADLKTGAGHLVPAKSPQFLTYLVGILEKYGWDRWNEIECGPVQLAALDAEDLDTPGDPCPTAKVTVDELREHHKAIKKAIKASYKAEADGTEPPASCVGGHCHWCPRRTDWALNRTGQPCPAHRSAALSALDDEQTAIVPIKNLGPEQRAFLLEKAADIRKFLDALEEGELEAQQVGRGLPGFKVVEGRSNRKWDPAKTDDEVAKSLAELSVMLEKPLDPYRRSVITITEAEKVLGKGVVDALTVKPKGSPKLAPASDKRPALTMTAEVLDD
jgi:hypothetical protein